MPANKGRWTRARKDKLIRLRDKEGLTWSQIAAELGTSKTNCFNQYSKYAKESTTGEPTINAEPAPEPPDVVDELHQERKSGMHRLDRHERAATVQEIHDMSGLGDDWRAQKPEVAQWEMAYKLKNFLPRKTMAKLVEIVKGGGGVQDCYEELEVAQTGHNKVKLYSTRVKFTPVMDNGGQDVLKKWVEKHASKPLPKKRWKPHDPKAELLVNWGYYDTHIGMYSWAKETGHDWDVGIALTRVLNSVDEMIERFRMLPSIDKAIVVVGNDLGHFDGVRQTTSMGDHHLDVDTRYPRVMQAATAALAYQIERMCEIANEVILIWVPGNHDTSMSYGIFLALWQRFLKWPQVSVVDHVGERKYQYFHQCIIGFDHGKLKPEAYQAIIMNECRGHLDNATYVEMNVGHTHEAKQQILKTSVPTNGVQVRTHPSLCPADSWHYGKGFLGAPRKSVEALYYSPEGRIGDFVVWASDDRKRKIDDFIDTTIGG